MRRGSAPQSGSGTHQDCETASKLERDRERQKRAGYAEGLHVGDRRRIAVQLRPGFVQKNRGKKEPAEESGGRLQVTACHRGQFVFGGACAIASSRSASSSQPAGQSFFNCSALALAFSIWPVST